MDATPLYTGQSFYAPRFEIKLKGQNIDREVIRDVLEVRYSDKLDQLDSFEFTLHDWDSIQRQPKYSSPFDEAGKLRKVNGKDVPNFEPGAKIELYMGYYPNEPRLIMTGQVVSLTPGFPSSGTPTLKVRALSLLYSLQRAKMVKCFENKTDSEIAKEIGRDLGIEVEIPPGQEKDEQHYEYIMMQNEYPIIFLMSRARRQGYDLYVKIPDTPNADPVLFFGRAKRSDTTYQLTWGRSLVQFTPTLKTKGQIGKVVVRGWNPKAKGDKRAVTGEATLNDVKPNLPDQKLLSSIDSALSETHEVVVDDPIESEQEAIKKAQGILSENLKDLITGSGSTIGLPELRAGRTVLIDGLGLRYSGKYTLTETTHVIGSGGYTTEFQARMEGAS